MVKVEKRNGFYYKKSLGQNFIFDKNLLNAVVVDAGITPSDTVLEIGAGGGTLTAALSSKAKQVIAIEIDKSLSPILQKNLHGLGNVTLIFDDILRLSHNKIDSLTKGRFKVVANLPYYITTPVLFHLLESLLNITSLTVMVQKEVALRMTAKPSTKDYGALTLAIKSRGEAAITRIVDKTMFTPMPAVDSAVVRLDITQPYNSHLSNVIKGLFGMRRKTILNNMVSAFDLSKEQASKILLSLNIDEKARSEQLNLEKIKEIATSLANNKNNANKAKK